MDLVTTQQEDVRRFQGQDMFILSQNMKQRDITDLVKDVIKRTACNRLNLVNLQS